MIWLQLHSLILCSIAIYSAHAYVDVSNYLNPDGSPNVEALKSLMIPEDYHRPLTHDDIRSIFRDGQRKPTVEDAEERALGIQNLIRYGK